MIEGEFQKINFASTRSVKSFPRSGLQSRSSAIAQKLQTETFGKSTIRELGAALIDVLISKLRQPRALPRNFRFVPLLPIIGRGEV